MTPWPKDAEGKNISLGKLPKNVQRQLMIESAERVKRTFEHPKMTRLIEAILKDCP